MGFWSSETLKDRIPADALIIPYDPGRVKHCAYEMGVGPEAFVTSRSGDSPRLLAGEQIDIPPGQFVLLITAETVTIPLDAIGFISIRAGIKFRGLINVSGFHVDPGFSGPLKFAVYNAGSQSIRLDQGQPIFMIWFCDLDDPTQDAYKRRVLAQNVITAADVEKIQGEVASPAELKKKIEDTKTELEKKIHAVEQSKLFNRTLILVLFTAIVTLFSTSFIKPYFDGSKDTVKPPIAQASVNATTAVKTNDAKMIALPAHLGFYILGAGSICGLSVIAAAFIARSRPKP